MLKYSGFLIKTEPDYSKMIKQGEEMDTIWCTVYDENDTEMEHSLGEFNMMRCFEFMEETADSIEKGIYKCIDEDYSSFLLEKERLELQHTKELLYRAIHYMKATLGEEGLDKILQKELGMNKNEINDALSEPENTEGINMI